jgi:hypothetical protein
MKKFLVLVLAAVAAWWIFVGRNRISESDVQSFYSQQAQAMAARDAEALCATLADDFEGAGVVSAQGVTSGAQTLDKPRTCQDYESLFESLDKLGGVMGSAMQSNFATQVTNVRIADDHKSATVDVESTLDVAPSIMHLHALTTETVVRRNGKTLLLESSGTVNAGR